ncbi:MAG: PD40 domain-containing protein [Acidobacteria bacterium]|nr:PD40 domain-containing protein [Acidobacteriota bacterium]
MRRNEPGYMLLGKSGAGWLFGLVLILLTIGCAADSTGRDDEISQQADGPYLGLNVPAEQPVLFAPGNVCTGRYERDMAVSADGREIFYGMMMSEVVTILTTRQTDNGWTDPEVVEFAGDLTWRHLEPCLSPDGNRLFFLTTRPTTGEEAVAGWGCQNIFAADRRADGGWGEPWDPGPAVNTAEFEYFPSMTRDGVMYFTRSAPRQAAAIWRARPAGRDGFLTAENIPLPAGPGESIFNACIAPDESYLVACVTGRADSLAEGKANYYVYFRGADDTWSEAVNLGPLVNPPGVGAVSPAISADGAVFFFAAQRRRPEWDSPRVQLTLALLQRMYAAPQNGLGDIYWVSTAFITRLRPEGRSAGKGQTYGSIGRAK